MFFVNENNDKIVCIFIVKQSIYITYSFGTCTYDLLCIVDHSR